MSTPSISAVVSFSVENWNDEYGVAGLILEGSNIKLYIDTSPVHGRSVAVLLWGLTKFVTWHYNYEAPNESYCGIGYPEFTGSVRCESIPLVVALAD